MDFYLSLKLWDEILVKNISKNISCKYSQKRIDQVKQFTTDILKTAGKRAV